MSLYRHSLALRSCVLSVCLLWDAGIQYPFTPCLTQYEPFCSFTLKWATSHQNRSYIVFIFVTPKEGLAHWVTTKGVPISISASAYRHFFSISAYRLSANIFSADIADIWISAFWAISTPFSVNLNPGNIGNIGNHQYRRIGISAKMPYRHTISHEHCPKPFLHCSICL